MVKHISFIIVFFTFTFSNTVSAHNHFPITTDSKLMIERGKIAYEKNCVSCHMINLAGAENWKGMDEDGHRKAPPLNGTGCLLYTSPSPRDKRQSRMPSSA